MKRLSVIFAVVAALMSTLLVSTPAQAAMRPAKYENRVAHLLPGQAVTSSARARCMDRVLKRRMRTVRPAQLRRRCNVRGVRIVRAKRRAGPVAMRNLLVRKGGDRFVRGLRHWRHRAVEARRTRGGAWVVVAATAKPNRPPIARFSHHFTSGGALVLDGSASRDRDHRLRRRVWFINNRRFGTGPTLVRSNPNPGTYTVRLKVVDSNGVARNRAHLIQVPGTATTMRLGDAAQGILDGTNRFRARHDRVALSSSECLRQNAERHARYLASKGRLVHQDLDEVRAECHVRGWIAENILYNYDGDPQYAVDQWINSEAHRKNMLKREYRYIGVAQYHDPDTGRHYAVQVFGQGF